MANTYFNLGLAHLDLEQYEQALECMDKALQIKLRCLGPEHQDTAEVKDKMDAIKQAMVK